MERHHWAKVAAVFLVIRSDLGERMLHDTLRLDKLHYFPHSPLVRWNHPSRGLLPPAEFIHVAERIRVIDQLGGWVLKTACRQLAQWRQDGLPEFTVAVNISPIHFRDAGLLQVVLQVLQTSGLSAKDLELEITESALQVSEEQKEVFGGFVDHNINLAIDDFGTGYSSLASIVHLPISCLKIDRDFVNAMLQSPTAATMVGTVTGLAHAMEYKVVAEGVESLDQAVSLLGMGCNTAQGYYFSRPVGPAMIAELATKDFFQLGQNALIRSIIRVHLCERSRRI